MQTANHWLRRFSMITVVAAFALILVGSLVTTNGAGMAFADWPLSSGSVNPAGWWFNFFERLEHGHRLFAELTGCLVGILCAWIWENGWAVPVAFMASGVLSMVAKFAGAPPAIIAHIGLWSSVAIFAGMLFWKSGRQGEHANPPLIRWLAFAAFCGVVVQAVLGGFRVTEQAGGNSSAAMIFRIVHGCFAQIEFGLLVVIASMLSFRVKAGPPVAGIHRVRNLAWLTFGFIFLQLIFGATMRHMGAGLAIPTFPKANAGGGWLPAEHTPYIDINFTHTRVLVSLVVIHVILLVRRVFVTAAGQAALTRPALLLGALIVAQVGLGVAVIWTYRMVLPTTLHVINGAAIFATSLLLAVRATLFSSGVSEAGDMAFSQNLRKATA